MPKSKKKSAFTADRGNRPNTGALTEMEVAVDLMARGFYVYRNVSPTGPIDMVAVSRDGEIRTIQATKILARLSHQDQPFWSVLAVRYPNAVRYFDRGGNELSLLGWGKHPTKGRPRAAQAAKNDIIPEELKVFEILRCNVGNHPLHSTAHHTFRGKRYGWVKHPTEKGTWVRPWDPALNGTPFAPRALSEMVESRPRADEVVPTENSREVQSNAGGGDEGAQATGVLPGLKCGPRLDVSEQPR
jgi:hypothetical protein